MTRKQKEKIRETVQVFSGLGIFYFTIVGVVTTLSQLTDSFLIIGLIGTAILIFLGLGYVFYEEDNKMNK
jgi:Kef-type K+ transport system membrane component KefB